MIPIFRYVGALTGILSFILFLPFLFKENNFVHLEIINNEGANIDNRRKSSAVEYLATSNNIDLNFGEQSNTSKKEIQKTNASSRETTSSGFVSIEANSTQRNFWGKYRVALQFMITEAVYYSLNLNLFN